MTARVAPWVVLAVACGTGGSAPTSATGAAGGDANAAGAGGGATGGVSAAAGGTGASGWNAGGGGTSGGGGTTGCGWFVGGAAGVSAAGAGGFAGAEMLIHGPEGPSCAGGLTCAGGISCCESTVVGGTFFWPGSTTQTTIANVAIDLLPVTVGRYRAFVAAYDAWMKPAAGDGANPAVPCNDPPCTEGQSGWQKGWNAYLPDSAAHLRARLASCDGPSKAPTWTDEAGPNEERPINCVDWFESFAFCIWDGGRLPFAGEWLYAAAGGDQQRTYPWGNEPPDATREAMICNCCFATCPSTAAGIPPVGSLPACAGRWGHLDLGGSVLQWLRDLGECTYPPGASCNGPPECACLSPDSDAVPVAASVDRLVVGGGEACDPAGSAIGDITYHNGSSQYRLGRLGVRCARQVKLRADHAKGSQP